ncbi:uncharacterized protein P174DRAFT_303811 [Aspergillus novofumigatus IBT 16806]|uniref:Uncharacterized protein n=1 Tax=Aspergillus novofumigatus (strain IBT 16806) TaxID=1392255 RepID=A0A2I1BWC4_ASPN1|nr:uncharacterized protein P174DRAFT_303811 [Aspergillus novofumigatus IBT 16806]PKX89682.1 hypothetical protein P174DRAFT_303811 [Aspergillus novofumigatus IBT 16806]
MERSEWPADCRKSRKLDINSTTTSKTREDTLACLPLQPLPLYFVHSYDTFLAPWLLRSSFHQLINVHSTENPDRKGDGDLRHKTGLRFTLAESRTLQFKVLFFASYKFRFHWLIAIAFMENKGNLPDFRYSQAAPHHPNSETCMVGQKNQGSRVHDRPKKEDYFHEVRRFVQIKAY